MFGEFILVSTATVISAAASKSLEKMGKEKQAKFLDLFTKFGLGLLALRYLNKMVKELDVFL